MERNSPLFFTLRSSINEDHERKPASGSSSKRSHLKSLRFSLLPFLILAQYLPSNPALLSGEDNMTKNNQGLCLTCVHFKKCTLTAGNGATSGVQFCEEYQTVCLDPVVVTGKKNSRNTMKRTSSGILGLCCNCVHYPYCSFPKPEAGVWHCEDYQ